MDIENHRSRASLPGRTIASTTSTPHLWHTILYHLSSPCVHTTVITMTLGTDPPSYLASITNLLANLHLQDILPSDQYLSQDVIQNAFTGSCLWSLSFAVAAVLTDLCRALAFFDELSRLPAVEKDLTGMVMAGMFTKLLKAVSCISIGCVVLGCSLVTKLVVGRSLNRIPMR